MQVQLELPITKIVGTDDCYHTSVSFPRYKFISNIARDYLIPDDCYLVGGLSLNVGSGWNRVV